MLWICDNEVCGAAYAVGLPACPGCGATDHHEQGEDMAGPKASKHGGTSFPPTGTTAPSSEPTGEPAEPTGDAFDPNTHTVAEVNDYLDNCDDPDERQRVLDAETAGKNRSGVRSN